MFILIKVIYEKSRSSDIIQGLPKVEQLLELRLNEKRGLRVGMNV